MDAPKTKPADTPPLTPAEVYRRLAGEYTGPSIARAIAAYHALVTGQPLPPK